jgi:hypothetical protein
MSDFTDLQDQAPEDGLDRRQMIKRAALVGGALVWATPVVQSIGGTAFASTVGSPGGGGGNGAPSYVFVFFDCGAEGNFVVKYGQDGTAEVCGATIQQVSDDGSQAVLDKFAAIYAAHGPYESGCPTDVTSGLDPVDNDLVITLDGSGCTIVDWFLHDGSCQTTGDDRFRWQGDGETPSVASFDPTAGGTWQFQKCAP